MLNVIGTVRQLFAEAGKRLDYAQDLIKIMEPLYAPAAKKFAFLNKEPLRSLMAVAGLKDKRYRFCLDWYDLTKSIPLGDMTDQDGQTRFVWLVVDPEQMKRGRAELTRFLTEATPSDAQSRVLILMP